MPVEYAEVIDGLSGQWMATGPTTGGSQVAPYQTGAGGGYAVPARPVSSPPVGGSTWKLDLAYEAETYTTPTGARAWKPTAADDALIDAVTAHPYSGVDELLEAQGEAAARAAGRGSQYLPYVGDVVGGAVDGAAAYGATGSLAQGIGAGVGSTAGGIGGSAIGGAIGAVGGPVGVFVGAAVGGAIGSAIGRAIGQGLGNLIDGPPLANQNGATGLIGTKPFNPNDGGDFTANGGVQIIFYSPNNRQTIVETVLSFSTTPLPELAQFFGPNYGAINYSTCNGGQGNPGVDLTSIQVNPGVRCDPTKPAFDPTVPVPVTGPIDPTKNPNRSTPTGEPVNLPGPQPNPNPRPNPIGGPGLTGRPSLPSLPSFPSPDPIGGPVPTGQPVPGGDDKKKPYPTPSPNPDPDPPNPNPTEQPGPDSGECDPCIELAAIRAKLDETFSLAWELPACETTFPINRTGEKSGQGLAGLSQKIDALYQALKVVHDNTRCDNESFVVIPDSWPVKVGSDRPQLILVYASKNSDKTWGSRRYEFVIPHFDGKLRKALKTLVPKTIKKGSEMGTYTLADNSKIITYCKTKEEAMRILNAFDKLVLKSMKTNNKKTGEINPNTKFLEMTLYPYEARFFSQGQHNPNHDWKDKLY